MRIVRVSQSQFDERWIGLKPSDRHQLEGFPVANLWTKSLQILVVVEADVRVCDLPDNVSPTIQGFMESPETKAA